MKDKSSATASWGAPRAHAQATHARQKGDPDSGGYQFKIEVDLTTVSSNLRRDSFAAAGIKDQFIECEAFLEQDEGEPRKACEFDRLPASECVTARQEHHQRAPEVQRSALQTSQFIEFCDQIVPAVSKVTARR